MRAIPPPVWVLLLLLATYGLSFVPAAATLPSVHAPLIGGAILVAALAIIAIAVNTFRKAGTQLLPNSPVNNALVETGIFARSRNPMYLGMVLICLGAALIAGHATMLIAPIAMFAVTNWVFIPFEEAKMRRQFGDAFDAYTKRVRRWI